MQNFLGERMSEVVDSKSTSNNIKASVLSEIYRVLGIIVDFSVDPQLDQLFKNSTIQRCLSMQASLGYHGESKPRSLPSKVAWTILKLRITALILTGAFSKTADALGTEIGIRKPGR